ncbi:hypothetical protein [Hansschlegelia zhihuaiae]|uniref:Uncharacterized protein n=1 Tax=Hansschlegelia zhihuaiae TaxID=405005 RepID=A0A4Q0M357_9HYPH|nr:hypothetical protein [Hansschlegelia zhihuaiae]RXF67099.1 hypothetical protein EK403_21795 [Hansschlegelia zhihuaiae]
MRTISGLLQIIGLLVIAIAGYWVWFVNWGPNPNDRVGTTVATLVPQQMREWGCGKLNQRFAAEAPTVCSPVATPNAPTPNSDPSAPAPNGGGRL